MKSFGPLKCIRNGSSEPEALAKILKRLFANASVSEVAGIVMKTHLAVNGALGRMGQRLVHLAQEDSDLVLTAVIESADSPHLGRDIGELSGLGSLGVPIRDTVPPVDRVDVLIDFSTPEGTLAVLPACSDRRIPLVVATTGHTAAQRAEIDAAAHMTALLFSPNTSLAVNVLFELVRQAAGLFAGKGFDVEIIERHHRFKKDAPSGTALHCAQLIQTEMGQMQLRHGRHGEVGQRPPQEIGIHAVRVGDNVGEHTVIFSTLGETLEVVHKGHTRDSYARGALLAAKFLTGKPPGRYTMKDVLGI
jgi:4-hydroxy-tetrahydrodipicolinate reductase